MARRVRRHVSGGYKLSKGKLGKSKTKRIGTAKLTYARRATTPKGYIRG